VFCVWLFVRVFWSPFVLVVCVCVCTVESKFGPKRGFGVTPGELLTSSKPNPYPKSEKPPARKGFTKPNL